MDRAWFEIHDGFDETEKLDWCQWKTFGFKIPKSHMNKSKSVKRLTAKKQKRDMESLACRGTAQKNHLSVIFEKMQDARKGQDDNLH